MTFKALRNRLNKCKDADLNTQVCVALNTEDILRFVQESRSPVITVPLDLNQGNGAIKLWFVRKEQK